jgi:hypothetical protein
MTTEATPRTYSGIARVLDYNGWLIDVGKGEFGVDDPGAGSWSGTIAVFRGSSLDAKLVTGLVELADGRRGQATVGPRVATLQDDLVAVKVRGIDGTIPF